MLNPNRSSSITSVVTESTEPYSCSICLGTAGGSVEVITVKTNCCNNKFHLPCISRYFASQPLNSRKCALCRQSPLPLINVTTGVQYANNIFMSKELFDVCLEGNLEELRTLLVSNRFINTKNDEGETLLTQAVSSGCTEVVKHLIEAGADVNTCVNKCVSPLMVAITKQIDLAILLIEEGADVNHKMKDGVTPLLLALKFNQTDLVRLIIEKGADVNHTEDTGVSPLMIALKTKQTEVVKLLIEKEADVNYTEDTGLSPLMLALITKQTEVVKLLIEKGADVNYKLEGCSVTSLLLALQNKQTEVVKLLIENGADFKYLDANQTKQAEAVKLLIENGTVVNLEQ